MPDLSEKVFIITGGNGGIGLGLAEGIAEAGGAVAIGPAMRKRIPMQLGLFKI